MEKIITEEELNKLLKTKGEIRGFAIKPMLSFIIREEGESGFEKLLRAMSELGSPIDYKKIKVVDFYSFNWHVIFIIVIQKLFNWDDQKFQEMGKFYAKALLPSEGL